ncbi:endophilin-B1 [Kryptolebias marmoratus]|uniref:endophilin-B1 n=1 Tax=Kryptolebias marmoratus TaxID=37003 RepID=UPI0018AC9FED|nr:endophilin-B1 [Kryptolebias marmoratus]
MDLTRFAVGAGQFINRAVQYTGESLGQAERTQLDPALEELLARADSTKTWTDQIISQTEVLLQPSLGARLEERLYEHLEWSIPSRPHAHELLGDKMTQAGLEIGSNTPYGTALIKCGETQKQLGEAERKFVKSINIYFLTPLRSFTEGEYRVIQNEHKMLVNKRLDLDIAKRRLMKAHEAEREARNLNASPLEEDYLAHVSYMFSFLRVKWLKIWAQEISQAEMELRICQCLFNRQSEITRQVVEGIGKTHTNHMQSLINFVDAQSSYFAQCDQHAQELQQQLSRIPAVLCSNNWQSAVSNEVHLPSTSSHVANNEFPTSRRVHRLPDFNHDSWTETDSSLSALAAGDTNKNNNTFFTQENRDHLDMKRQLCASQTCVFKSNQTEEHEAASRTGRTCGTTNMLLTVPPASIETVSVSVNNDAGGGKTTAAYLLSQADAISIKSQPASPEAAEILTPQGEVSDSQKNNET